MKYTVPTNKRSELGSYKHLTKRKRQKSYKQKRVPLEANELEALRLLAAARREGGSAQ